MPRQKAEKFESEPALPEFAESGVDLTLIRWMLSMTPTERLRTLQSAVNSLARMRRETQR